MPLWLWDVKRGNSALYILFNQRIYKFIRAGFSFQEEINHFFYWKLLGNSYYSKKYKFFAILESQLKKENKKKKKCKRQKQQKKQKTPQYLWVNPLFTFNKMQA